MMVALFRHAVVLEMIEEGRDICAIYSVECRGEQRPGLQVFQAFFSGRR